MPIRNSIKNKGYEPEWTEEEFAKKNAGIDVRNLPVSIRNVPSKFAVDQELSPNSKPRNSLTSKKVSYTPKTMQPDSHSAMWGQKVGKTGIPLDVLVQTAGMISSSLDPSGPGQGFGGRLGEKMEKVGSEAYTARMIREYEGPNRLLALKKQELAIKEAQEKSPGMWDAVFRASGNDAQKALETFYSAQRAPNTNIKTVKLDDKVLVFRGGQPLYEIPVTPKFKLKEVIVTDQGVKLLGEDGTIKQGPVGTVKKLSGTDRAPKAEFFRNPERQTIVSKDGNFYVLEDRIGEDGKVTPTYRRATASETNNMYKMGSTDSGLFIKEMLDRMDEADQGMPASLTTQEAHTNFVDDEYKKWLNR